MKLAHPRSTDFTAAKAAEVRYQPASIDIWDKKYRLKSKDGQAIDENIDQTYLRVARALSEVETTAEKREYWCEKFLSALRKGAIPAGRIVSNAGALAHKPATSTINCTVSGTIHDSMDDILEKVHEAGLTLKAGCGIGYEFSTLRPKGAYVSGAGAYTSGPLSFMDIYDRMCFTVSSAGGRRGAQMATFDIGHPDVMDFIRAKQENGRLRQFNLSLLIDRRFMEALDNDEEWPLAFPLTPVEREEGGIDLDDPDQVVWREWPIRDGYIGDDEGRVACRIYRKIRARRIWDVIMTSTYNFAEPGLILIDQINEMNNNWFCENIRATNPCGEQPLPAYGACLLGSVNLTRYVLDPFTDRARFDWHGYRETIATFTRMLDNVVELHGLPIEPQRAEIERKRRHGMGFLGLGSTLALLGIRYGSKESLDFSEQVSREMALVGWRTGIALCEEKGPAPVMEEEFEITPRMLRMRPEMAADGLRIGDRVPGRVLLAKYSRYMQSLGEIEPQLVEEIAEKGAPLHPPHFNRSDRHHFAVARQQREQRHRAELRPPLLPQRHSREQKDQGKDRCLLLRAARLSRIDRLERDTRIRASGLLRERRRHHPRSACGRAGGGAALGGFLHFEDDKRTYRFRLRELQGHLSLRLPEGPQGMHHLPIQPGGLPRRAREKRGSQEHDLRLHAGRRNGSRGRG